MWWCDFGNYFIPCHKRGVVLPCSIAIFDSGIVRRFYYEE